MRAVLKLFPVLGGHWLSIVGSLLTTIAANVFLVFFVMDVVRGLNPYTSAVAYMILPLFFMLGLSLVALGTWRANKKRPKEERQQGLVSQIWQLLANDKRSRRRLAIFMALTLVNVVIVTIATYKGVNYTSSPSFCGSLCHETMEPEYIVYKASPHARVACAQCHVGSGIGPFFSSKLAGARQLWHMVTGDIPRPIPTPVHGLRPARHTCQQCHWPANFNGDRLLVRHMYKDDEKNTRSTNVVQLHVGGKNKSTGRYEGIHWHVSSGVKIRYESLDPKRTIIGRIWVEREGKKKLYFPPKTYEDPKTKKKLPYPTKVHETRTMDCVDCHNRPTHVYVATASIAVNQAMSLGLIDPSLPFVKKQAVALLKDVKASRVGAEKRYVTALQKFYAEKYPELAKSKKAEIEKSGKTVAAIYMKNIFPRMKIEWGTYPNHIGHRSTTEGCFRCHNDEHATEKKETLSQDCETCHEVLADDEEKPDVPAAMLKLGSY